MRNKSVTISLDNSMWSTYMYEVYEELTVYMDLLCENDRTFLEVKSQRILCKYIFIVYQST